MKIKVILLTIITLAFFTTCENPFYPFDTDLRYDFYGHWLYEIDGTGFFQDLIISRNGIKYQYNEYKIIAWEPYTNTNDDTSSDYPSGYHLKAVIKGGSAPEDIYIFIHNDGNRLIIGLNDDTFTDEYEKK